MNNSCPYILDPVKLNLKLFFYNYYIIYKKFLILLQICIECAESKEIHRHTDKMRGLKKFYENFSIHIDKL